MEANDHHLKVDVENASLAHNESFVKGALPEAERLQIVYRDLQYTVQVPSKDKAVKGKVPKAILKGCTGAIQPGRLTFVMGASGAGKTTFLNVLSGHANAQSQSGSIKVNGDEVKGGMMRRISGFVHQEDVLLETSSVREVLYFSAILKLPKTLSVEEKKRRALDVADLLGLTKALDNMVGSAMIKGISGGEKRRLSLGNEIITNPSILFLDEPTSGLDSATAFKVVRILSRLASTYQRTILCTIHQPSSDIFHIADDLIVLADGRTIYHGEIEHMVPFFSRIGYDCPTYTNPADYLFKDILNNGLSASEDSAFDFLNRSALSPTSANTKDDEEKRLAFILSSWVDSPENGKIQASVDNSSGTLLSQGIPKLAVQESASFIIQFGLLAQRAARFLWRNPLVFKAKAGQTIFLSIIIGLIYLRISSDYTGVQARQGSLFFIVVQGLFGSVMGALSTFNSEKIVFAREYQSNMYSLSTFFLSRWIVDLPSHIFLPILSASIMYFMIGYQAVVAKFFWFALILVLMDNAGAALGVFVSCLFPDINVAMAVMPMFLLPLMVFSGFFVQSDSIPVYFRWIQWISPMHYGFVALCLNEFTGLNIYCTESQGCAPGYSGTTVLANLGFVDPATGEPSKGSIGWNAGLLTALCGGFLLLAFVALMLTTRTRLS